MLAYFLALFATSIALSRETELIMGDSLDVPESMTLLTPSVNISGGCTGNGCQQQDTFINNSDVKYHAAQQIFYVQGPLQFRSDNGRFFTSKMRDDYTVTPEVGIHKLHRRRVKWNQARKICIDEGGHLAIINSLKEEMVLIKMMENQIDIGYLGVHDLYEEGDWTTVLDESLEKSGYAKWSTLNNADEPNNYAGTQHCAVLLRTGGMDDITCSNLHGFFCELPLSAAELTTGLASVAADIAQAEKKGTGR